MDSKVTITAELDRESTIVIETTSIVSAAAAATEAVSALKVALVAVKEDK